MLIPSTISAPHLLDPWPNTWPVPLVVVPLIYILIASLLIRLFCFCFFFFGSYIFFNCFVCAQLFGWCFFLSVLLVCIRCFRVFSTIFCICFVFARFCDIYRMSGLHRVSNATTAHMHIARGQEYEDEEQIWQKQNHYRNVCYVSGGDTDLICIL